ncbi:MAG TPA: S8 family serine peptidase, partial [Capillimicrobium sp.]
NELGVSGVARTSSILPVKVFKNDGKFTSGRLADGLVYADRMGAEIANVSLVVGVWTNAVSDAITEAEDTLVVAGAGNDDYDLDKLSREAYPCESNHANVICVGGHLNNGADAAWSNEGDEVDLAAPGEDITTTGMAFASEEGKVDDLDEVSGTSVSAAHVSGVAALMWGMNQWIDDQNQWTYAERARHMLLESVIDEPSLHGRVASGGRLDAYGALLELPLRMPKVVTYDAAKVDKTYFIADGKIGHRGINITQVGMEYRIKGQPATAKSYWYQRTRESLGLIEGAVGDTVVPLEKGTTYEYRFLGHNPYGTNDLSPWKTVVTLSDPPPFDGPGQITSPPRPTHSDPTGPVVLADAPVRPR